MERPLLESAGFSTEAMNAAVEKAAESTHLAASTVQNIFMACCKALVTESRVEFVEGTLKMSLPCWKDVAPGSAVLAEDVVSAMVL